MNAAVETANEVARANRTAVQAMLPVVPRSILGWLIVIAINPLRENLTAAEFGWIAAGGLLYTGGVPFYIWKSRRYTHAVWHLFVLGGVACHFAAVLSLVSGRDG